MDSRGFQGLTIMMLTSLLVACGAFLSDAQAENYTRVAKLETIDKNTLWSMREVSIQNARTGPLFKYWSYSRQAEFSDVGGYIPKMLFMVGGRRDKELVAILISTKKISHYIEVNGAGPRDDFLFHIVIMEERHCSDCEKAEFWLREIDGVLFLNEMRIEDM